MRYAHIRPQVAVRLHMRICECISCGVSQVRHWLQNTLALVRLLRSARRCDRAGFRGSGLRHSHLLALSPRAARQIIESLLWRRLVLLAESWGNRVDRLLGLGTVAFAADKRQFKSVANVTCDPCVSFATIGAVDVGVLSFWMCADHTRLVARMLTFGVHCGAWEIEMPLTVCSWRDQSRCCGTRLAFMHKSAPFKWLSIVRSRPFAVAEFRVIER